MGADTDDVERLRSSNTDLQKYVKDLVRQVKALSDKEQQGMTRKRISSPDMFKKGDTVRRANREGVIVKVDESDGDSFYVVRMTDDGTEVGTEKHNMTMVKPASEVVCQREHDRKKAEKGSRIAKKDGIP